MNAREGIDLTKMAITATLVTIVIGACFSVWNLLSSPVSDFEKSLTKTVNSAATDRLYDMQDISSTAINNGNYEDFPLVSNICNILSEYNEDSLLFVYCTSNNNNVYTTPHVFTYRDVTIESFPGFPGANVSVPINPYPNTQQPLTYAVKYLLPYSQYRCILRIVDYDYGGNTYIGVIVDVLTGGTI